MNLSKHYKKHALYYVSFISIQLVGWMLFILVGPDARMQMMMALLTAFSTTIFALVHHKVSHTLTSKIVVEYVLIAALGIGLVLMYLK